MTEEEFWATLKLIAFGIGIILLLVGLGKLSEPPNLEEPESIVGWLWGKGTGTTYVIAGLILILAVIAPGVLKVAFKGHLSLFLIIVRAA